MKKTLTRLIRGMSLLAVCFAVGTLIAESLIIAYVCVSWKIDSEKLAHMATIARGEQMVAVSREQLRLQKALPTEQPSFAEIVELRAVKHRNLELREQALALELEQLCSEQLQQTDALTQFEKSRNEFQKKLREITEYQKSNGLQENIVMLQNMKPAQAKEQLLRVYEAGQSDQVVMLVSGMEPMKRKKILAQFNTPEDNKILADVLQRIRLGTPLALLADQTLNELETAANTRK